MINFNYWCFFVENFLRMGHERNIRQVWKTHSEIVAHEAVDNGIDKGMCHWEPVWADNDDQVAWIRRIVADIGHKDVLTKHPKQLKEMHWEPTHGKYHYDGD